MMDYLRYYIAPLMIGVALLGVVLGGAWTWLGALIMVILAFLDEALPKDFASRRVNNPALVDFSIVLCLPFFIALWLTFAWQIGQGFTTGEIIGSMLSVGMVLGVVGLASAHEFMHRKSTPELIISDLLLNNAALPITGIGHVVVHHNHVGTDLDGDTAKRGESIYKFVWRSIPLLLIATWRLEFERLKKIGKSYWSFHNPILVGSVCVIALAAAFCALAGWIGLLIFPATAILGLIFWANYNYCQHYGIVRAVGTPLEIRHSWNHLGPISRAISYEITAHSDHHLDPDKPFYQLPAMDKAPQMPGIMLCFLATLIPPLWDRLIAMPRLRAWDLRYANQAERALAKAQNIAAGWPVWQDLPGQKDGNVQKSVSSAT